MTRFLAATIMATLLMLCSNAFAGQIWTDGNGDGLPDTGPIPATPSTNVTVGVWIDSQTFTWTNFLAYVEWTSDCISYVSAQYAIIGGSNFPIDDFSHPRGLGFMGSGFNQSGVDLIGTITLHVNTPISCCVTPIIDIYNPYYVFSQLGAGSLYSLFSSTLGTCLGSPPPTGACCLSDQSCMVQSMADCAAAGGWYMGDGTSCEGRNCLPPPEGACCFADNSCAEISPADCEAGGGTYRGDNASCSNACPQACCLPDKTCSILLPNVCVSQGGVPRGPGTVCDGSCEAFPAGACCLPDGSCAILLFAECVDLDGDWQGSNVTCEQTQCPQPTGACCMPNGTCQVWTPAACGSLGGLYQGDGVLCSPSLCDPAEACCYPSGECVDLVPTQCSANGGVPQGPGSLCGQAACPQPPVGACCYAPRFCVEADSFDCTAINGEYQGDGTKCGSPYNPCPTNAVESKSWGGIKGLFR